MQEVGRAPLTFGQLSLWRAIEKWPMERMKHANTGLTWSLPAGCTLESVRHSLNVLSERHEGLRTGYVASGHRNVEQVTWAPTDVPVATAELGAGTGDRAVEMTRELAQKQFALERDRPWRVLVITDRGRPARLAVAVHHITVDAWAVDIFRAELLDLLADRPLGPPGPTCRFIAEEQRSAGRARRRESALAHWRHALDSVDLPRTEHPSGPVGPAPVSTRSVHLRSSGLASATRVLADRLQVTAHGVVLAAFCRTLSERTGRREFVVLLMSGNRGEPGWRSVVGSFNQLVPLVVQVDPAEDFGSFARRVNRDATVAYWNGCYDPDSRAELGASYGRRGSTLGIPFVFNFVGDRTKAAAEPAGEQISESSAQGVGIGYPLYFVADGGGLSSYSLREITSAPDGAQTRAHLQAFRTVILDECGDDRLGGA